MSSQEAVNASCICLQVDASLAGRRLSHAVAQAVSGLSNRAAKKLVDSGRVFVNEQRVMTSSFSVSQGERLEVYTELLGLHPCLCWEDVLWQGEGLIAINKPPGVLVQGGIKDAEHTVLPQLSHLLQKKGAWHKGDRLKLVHRLDRDTSGLLLVAREEKAAVAMEKLFRQRKVSKSYQVIVKGSPEKERFRQISDIQVKRPLGEKKGPIKPKQILARSAGTSRRSKTITEFKILERFPASAWLEARPLSGRTHQIRNHLSQCGHPVLGDTLYGDRRVGNKIFRAIPRQMLHAAALEFEIPGTGKGVELKVPMPADMQHVLDWLRLMD